MCSIALLLRQAGEWHFTSFDESAGIWGARQPQRYLVKQNSADVGDEKIPRHRLNRRSCLHSQVRAANMNQYENFDLILLPVKDV